MIETKAQEAQLMSRILVPNIFQHEALAALAKAEHKGRGVVVLPTGVGKTFLAALWYHEKLMQNPKSKLLFVCHNNDILSQANEREFQHLLTDFNIQSSYYNGEGKIISQATFATAQTLIRNLNSLDPQLFDYIIVDEAHHYQAKGFKKAVLHFKPKFLLGLTATPNRMDNKSIFEVCGQVVYRAKMNDAIKRNLLTKINYYCVDNDIDFSQVKRNGKNYDESDLNKKVCIPEYDEAIYREYVQVLKGKFHKKKTICFCATVEHVYRMAKVFKSKGVRAVGLTADSGSKDVRTPIKTRKEIMDGFKQGDYEIIFVRDLFNEGVDVPDADSIMMLRPTQSHTIFTQQIGRGLRKSPGKEDVLIMDFTGNANRCSINFEVLSDALELDLVKTAMGEREKHPKEDIIIFSNGSRVRFTQKKLDILGTEDSSHRNVSDHQLIDEYFRVKKVLGRKPTYTDFCYKDKVPKYSAKLYENRWGKWSAFIAKIGENETREETEKELREYYTQVKMELGHPPRQRDLKKYNSKKYISVFNCKDWKGVRHVMGDFNEGFFVQQAIRANGRTETDHIEEYKRISSILKRPAGKDDWLKLARAGFKGSAVMNEKGILWMRERAGYFVKNYSRESLIQNYNEVKKKIGKSPGFHDMYEHSGSKYSGSAYKEEWGSWNAFKYAMKDVSKRYTWTEEEIIQEYWNLKNRLRRIPKAQDFRNYQAIQRRYGTYKKFLQSIGEWKAYEVLIAVVRKEQGQKQKRSAK